MFIGWMSLSANPDMTAQDLKVSLISRINRNERHVYLYTNKTTINTYLHKERSHNNTIFQSSSLHFNIQWLITYSLKLNTYIPINGTFLPSQLTIGMIIHCPLV